MERGTFHDERVRNAFDAFVVLDAYVDALDVDEEVLTRIKDLHVKLGGSGQLPAYVVVDPEVDPATWLTDPGKAVIRRWGYKLDYVTDPTTFIAELVRSLDALAIRNTPVAPPPKPK